MAEKPRDPSPLQNLSEVFQCLICFDFPQDSRMCPHCSKFFCLTCLNKWMTTNLNFCPHCRNKLRLEEATNCRWGDDLKKIFESHDKEKTYNRCKNHGKKYKAYCVDCDINMCNKTALWGNEHVGHKIKSIEEITIERRTELIKQRESLQEKIASLNKQSAESERAIAAVKHYREQRLQEVSDIANAMREKLNASFQATLAALAANRDNQSSEATRLFTLESILTSEIESLPSFEIMRKYTELRGLYDEAQSNPTLQQVPAPSIPPSELVPSFGCGVHFTITDFAKLRQNGDMVVSPPLCFNGLMWKLNVFPNGCGIHAGKYLSVFVMLYAGYREAGQYEYRVEMIHPDINEKSKSGSFSGTKTFQVGSSWGLSNFFHLEALVREGFLDPQKDSLTFDFRIRPATYVQKCRDQENYIAKLQKNHATEMTSLSTPISSLPATSNLTVTNAENVVKEERISPPPTKRMRQKSVAEEENGEDEVGEQNKKKENVTRLIDEPTPSTSRDFLYMYQENQKSPIGETPKNFLVDDDCSTDDDDEDVMIVCKNNKEEPNPALVKEEVMEDHCYFALDA